MKQNLNKVKLQNNTSVQKSKAKANPFVQINGNSLKEVEIGKLIASGKSIYSIFIDACRNNNIDLIKLTINRPEITEQDIINGFIVASTFNCVSAASEIFQYGIDIHYNFDEPLRIAARTGAISVVKFLIANGADVKVNYYEPMALAKEKNNKELIDLLAANGGSPPPKDTSSSKDLVFSNNNYLDSSNDPNLQLYYACSNKKYEAVKEILKRNPNILKGSYLINKAITDKDLKLFRIMIPYGVDVKDMHQFLNACEVGYMPILRYFVTNGAEVVNITLGYACKRGVVKPVKYLMKNYIFSPTDISGAFADVIKECKKNKSKMLKFLLEKGADINHYNSDPLKNALNISDFRTVNFLIKRGAKPNYAIGLEHAAKTSNFKVIKYIFRKTNLKDVTYHLDYALTEAILSNHYLMAKYLIKKGASIKSSSERVLSRAILFNRTEHFDFLFNNGLNYNDVSVQTFIEAVKKKAFNILQYFLDKGFVINAKNAAPLMNLFQSSWLRLRESGYVFKDEEVNLTSIGKKPVSNNIEVYFDNRPKAEFVKAIKSKDILSLTSLFQKFEANDVFLKKLIFVAANNKNYSAKIMIILLSYIKDINSIDDQTLENLFKLNDPSIVKILVKNGLKMKERIYAIVVGILQSDNVNLFKEISWENIQYPRFKIFNFAVTANAAKIIAYFFKKKFNIKNNNYAALFMAIRKGNINLLKVLVSLGATFHPFEKRYLMLAYNYRLPNTLRYLIEDLRLNLNDVPDQVYQYYLLWRANKSSHTLEGADYKRNGFNIYANREEVIREDIHKIKMRYQESILSFIYSLSDDIYYAVNSNRPLAAEYLLSLANSEIINSTLLTFLLKGKFYEAKYLVMRGAKVNFENNKPMLLACLDNNIPFIEFLIQNGLRIHPDVDDGLDKSLINGCYEAANYLLSRGADIHYGDDTIIRSACLSQNEKLLNFLIGTNKFNKEEIVRNVEYSISNDKFFSAKILLHYLPGSS